MDDSELDLIGMRYGTDKCSIGHGYLRHYARLLEPWRHKPICVLEIGVERGGSLRTWSDYFDRATIVGVDINPKCRQHAGERRVVEIGSQADPKFLEELGRKYRPTVIIDDGSHKTDHIILSFKALWPHLAAGGLYLVEDVSMHGGKHSDPLRGTLSYPWAFDFFQGLSNVVSSPVADTDFDRSLAANVDAVEFVYGVITIRKKAEIEKDPISRRRPVVEEVNLPELWGRFAAYILNHQGNPAEAIECARRAIALNPGEAMHHYQLSLALEKAGNIDGATLLRSRGGSFVRNSAHARGPPRNTRREAGHRQAIASVKLRAQTFTCVPYFRPLDATEKEAPSEGFSIMRFATQAWRLSLIGMFALFLLALPAKAQEIWFGPPDNLPRGDKIANEDFPNLFAPEQKWQSASSKISLFAMTPYYAVAATDDQIRMILGYLSSRHIPLAVGMQPLPVEGCGQGVEGMTRPGVPGVIARRLKRLGANVEYFALDEPLEYGHIYHGKNACHFSVQEVANRLASTIRDLRAVYPGVKILDFEVPTDQPLSEWTATLSEWLDDYREATGTELDALAMDTNINKPWREAGPATIQILHKHGTKAGMFIIARGGPSVTDESWMSEAREFSKEIRTANMKLDFVIFSTWMGHPHLFVPDNNSLALTSLINYWADISGRRSP